MTFICLNQFNKLPTATRANCKFFTQFLKWSGPAELTHSTCAVSKPFCSNIILEALSFLCKGEIFFPRWQILSHHWGLCSNFWAFCLTLAAASLYHPPPNPSFSSQNTILSSSECWLIWKWSYLFVDYFLTTKMKVSRGPTHSILPMSLGCRLMFNGICWLTDSLAQHIFISH